MITRPLDLESRLSPPPRDFTALAWVNVGCIVLFFSLLGSRFVLAPGLLVELPRMDPASMTAAETSVVLKYSRDDVILFGSGKYSPAELRGVFEDFMKKNPSARGSTLLVSADKQVSNQALTELAAIAVAVGFGEMLVAGAPSEVAPKP